MIINDKGPKRRYPLIILEDVNPEDHSLNDHRDSLETYIITVMYIQRMRRSIAWYMLTDVSEEHAAYIP
jgi:hypothetical protein